jgi:hypothetical protein
VDYLLLKQRKILNYCPGLVDHYKSSLCYVLRFPNPGILFLSSDGVNWEGPAFLRNPPVENDLTTGVCTLHTADSVGTTYNLSFTPGPTPVTYVVGAITSNNEGVSGPRFFGSWTIPAVP